MSVKFVKKKMSASKSSSSSSSGSTTPTLLNLRSASNNSGPNASRSRTTNMNSLSLLNVDHIHNSGGSLGRRDRGGGGERGERHLTFSVVSSSSDLKLSSSYLQDPKTPNDKLNTPRTVTVSTTFFPPSPTPFVDNDMGNFRL